MTSLILSQPALAAALAVVTRASRHTPLMPAFELVRLQAEPGRLSLTCFNGECLAVASLPASGADAGQACVSAAALREIVQTLSGEIACQLLPHELLLENGPGRTRLRSSEEPLPEPSGWPALSFSLSAEDLRRLAGVVAFASSDSRRPVLQGVWMQLGLLPDGQAQVEAVAADGFTLARRSANLQADPALLAHLQSQPLGFLLPAGFVRTLAASLAGVQTVELSLDPSSGRIAARLAVEDCQVWLETVQPDGAFPYQAIQELIEKTANQPAATLDVSRAALEQAIRQVAAMGTNSLFFKAADGLIRLASMESAFGQARNRLPGQHAGPAAHAWLNTDFLARVVRLAPPALTLRIAAPFDPVWVQAEDLAALIMPLASDEDPFAGEQALSMPLEAAAAVPA